MGRCGLEDIASPDGRRVLGFEPFGEKTFLNDGEREVIAAANEILGF